MKNALVILLSTVFLAVSAPVSAESVRHHTAKASASQDGATKKRVKKKEAVGSKAKSSKKLSSKSKAGKKLSSKKKAAITSKAKSSKKLGAKHKSKLVAKSNASKKLTAKQKKRLAAKRAAQATLAAQAYDAGAYTGGPLDLRSAVALVVDQNTGETLYAKNPGVQTPIASITKLMTAMVTLDAGLPMEEEITIDSQDVDRLKYTSSRLAVGITLTRGELLHLSLIASENRAASALSRSYPGGRPAFIAAMNRKARELGMQHTRFQDGTGLTSENQSTAQDLVKMVDAAYRYPMIRQISTTGNYDVQVAGGKRQRHIAYVNTNSLTRRGDWEIGVSKTGYINEAGHCLVMQAQIAQQKVIIVLLDSWGKMSRIGDAARIRKWLEHSTSGKLASGNRNKDSV